MTTYLPSKFINNSYRYTLNNETITIHTNNNCFTQYQTQYCDCYNVYPKLDYIESSVYSCQYNTNSYISSSNFSSDIWYRIDLPSILIIFLILFIFIFKYPFRIISRLFGRWLKL